MGACFYHNWQEALEQQKALQVKLDAMTKAWQCSESNRWANFDVGIERGKEIDALKSSLKLVCENRDGFKIRVKELEGLQEGRLAECSHCGGILPEDDTTHWETCEKHPARKRIKELERLLDDEIKEADRWNKSAAEQLGARVTLEKELKELESNLEEIERLRLSNLNMAVFWSRRTNDLEKENDMLVEMLNDAGCREVCCDTCKAWLNDDHKCDYGHNLDSFCVSGFKHHSDKTEFGCSEWESKETNSE